MSAHCPGSELLLELSCELLEDEEAKRLSAHVSDCLACQAQQDLLGSALATPPEPAPPAEVLEALHRRIDEAEGRDQPAVPGEETVVRLLCTYCKDDLLKDEATFCAGCLAPHHDDCFAEHGRCSIAGCESKTTVRGVDLVPPAPKRKKLKAGILLLFSAVTGGLVVAALEPQRASQVGVAREVEADLTYREEIYDVADLVGAIRNRPAAVRRVIEVLERPAPKMAGEASLREVLEALRQRANLDVQVHPEATPMLDRQVVLAGEGLTISVVLSAALRQAGCAMRIGADSFEIFPAGALPGRIMIDEMARVDPSLANASMFGLKGNRTLEPEGLRLLVRAHCGPVWAPPAAIELRDGRLRVIQTEAQHRTIRRLLTRLSGGVAAEQPRPWSYPALAPAAPSQPGGTAACAERLRVTTLSLDQRRNTPLLSLVLSLEQAGVGVTVTPRAAKLYRDAKITVPIRGAISAEAALRTAFQSLSPSSIHARLRWEAGLVGVRLYDLDEPRIDHLIRSERWQARLQESLRRSIQLEATGGLPALLTRLHAETKIPFALSRRREVRKIKSVSASFNGPLDTQLDALLSARGLGLRLQDQAVWIVPKEEAGLEPARVATFLAGSVANASQVGVTVAGLVERLGAVTCRVDPSAAKARARMFFPSSLSRGELLELARLQGGIDAHVRFVSGVPVITLFAGQAPLVEAHALREELLDPDQPAHTKQVARGLRKRLRLLRRTFHQAFSSLHEAANTADCSFDQIQTAMLAVGDADRNLRDLLEISAGVVDASRLERAQRVRAEAFLAHQSRWNEAVRSDDVRSSGLLRPREEVSAPRLEAAAAEVAWLEAIRSLPKNLQNWHLLVRRVFKGSYRGWKARVKAQASKQIRVGLARLSRLGLAFDLVAEPPRVVGVLPRRRGAQAGVQVGDRFSLPPATTSPWESLVLKFGAYEGNERISLRFERGHGHIRANVDLGPQGASQTRR